jgi:hypothetical protein
MTRATDFSAGRTAPSALESNASHTTKGRSETF